MRIHYDKQIASSFLPESNNPHEQGCFENNKTQDTTSSVHTFTLLLHSTHSASKQRAVRLHFLQISISIFLTRIFTGTKAGAHFWRTSLIPKLYLRYG